MEKWKERTNKLATKAHDRRTDWISHTLEMVATDLKDGRRRNFD